MRAFRHEPLPELLDPSGETAEILAATVQHMRCAPSSLMIWSGPPGFGKTEAAKQLTAYLVQEAVEHSTPVVQMDWGGNLTGRSTRGMHRGLTTVYQKFVSDDSPTFLSRAREELLAQDIVEAFKRQGAFLFIIDEAGTMSADEMRGIGTLIDQANKARYRLHVLLISMDDITPKLEEHEVLDSRSTFDRDFVPWESDAVVRLLCTCGTTLAAILQHDESEALSVATELLNASAGDLRMITVIGQRMETAMCGATPTMRVDLLALARACVSQHRAAHERRQARANASPKRRTRRRRAA